ncbi:MAG: class I SAM-dependent methyltransferase, partial [Thermoplasmata archaeon]
MDRKECKTRKENVIKHYESQWEDHSEEDVLMRVENLKDVLDSIIASLTLKPGVRILDLGSGPGIIPIRIAQIFSEDIDICGIDFSERGVCLGNKVIKKMNSNASIHLIRGDVENLPFQESGYDAVV